MEILPQSPDKRIQHSQLGVIHELLKEFCSEEYSISGLGDNPLLGVEIMIDGKTIAIKAYLDTGCSTGISLSLSQARKLGLILPLPMNISPNGGESPNGIVEHFLLLPKPSNHLGH